MVSSRTLPSPEPHRIDVGALTMYADVQGGGPSLLLLHGGMCTIEASFLKLRPLWAPHRTTIAVEQQGHGRTPDIDRALRFEQMADETSAVLKALNQTQVDVFGYSDGGNVALALAMRHPKQVRRIAVYGTNANNEGLDDTMRDVLLRGAREAPEQVAAKMPEVLRKAYEDVAPQPDWPTLVHRVMVQAATFKGWSAEALRALDAPVLTMVGDHDAVTVAHALWMSQTMHGPLAVLPASDHSAPMQRADWIASMVDDFLDTQEA